METARAASIARTVSPRSTSCREEPETATMPREFSEAMWLPEVAADDRHVLKDPPAEGEERHKIEVYPEAIPEERQGRCQERIRIKPREEDPGVEVSLELGTARTEQRIEGREDADSRVASPFDREVESKREAQKHPSDEAEEREQHFRRD